MGKIKILYLLDSAHVNIEMAMHHARLAKYAKDDEAAMVHDHFYAEHMAHAMFYLTHARKLRIKERKNYGYQL